jgi:multidrug resistance efflux pump
MMQTTASLVTSLLLLAIQPAAETEPVTDGAYATFDRSKVLLIDDVEIPAEQAGVLKALHLENGTRVQEGVEVAEGELLGRLDDKDALARKRAAGLDEQVAEAEKRKSLVAIKSADATVKVADAEHEESLAVNARIENAIPATQLRRQQLTKERASAELDVAHSDSETAGLTVELRKAQTEVAGLNVERHQIRSALDGQIVKVFRHVGEWVNPGDPILRIVRLNRLRIEGFLKLGEYDRAEIDGQSVIVQIQLQRRVVEFEGKVTFVSPIIDASSEYTVWCEINNKRHEGQWLMLPGMQADVKIRLKNQQLAAQ